MKTQLERAAFWLQRTNVLNWKYRKRQDQAEQLMAFIMSERGRTKEVENTEALVLYFDTKAAREEFIEAYKAAHPNSVSRKVP